MEELFITKMLIAKLIGIGALIATSLTVAVKWVNKKTFLIQRIITRIQFYIQLLKRFK